MNTDAAQPDVGSTELLRVPKQERSRKKFNAILDSALKLIHQKGYEQVSVREIARECGQPIASVYQYFPNKASIVRQLWERYTGALSAFLSEEFLLMIAEPGAETLQRVTSSIVDHMVAYHRDNPEFLDIWRCVDSSTELRALNRQDTLDVAGAITDVVCQVDQDADPEVVFHRAIIACETANHTVQLAQELPEAMRAGVIENLKVVLVSIFDHLAE
jgi:AcrR family transcriptional regulator